MPHERIDQATLFPHCDLQFLLGYLPDYRALVIECERADGSIAVTPYVHNPRRPVHAESWHAGRPPIFGCLDDDAGPCFSEPPDAYADGGYPILYYLMNDRGGCDATLCAKCAGKERDERRYAISLGHYEADETREIVFWRGHPHQASAKEEIIGDVYYEGPPEICDECGCEIESAYGDPDAPKDAEDCHDDE